jgi:FSR family fosmidomycin resistance protein-like MFS transporter
MLGHFTVDLYGGLLPVLYPLLAREFGLSKGDVGLIALCFSAASSLSQPLFGYIADRYGSRYLAPVSLAWAAVMFGLVGLAPSTGMLALSAFLVGIGSGAYHPQGAANASASTGRIQKNTAMSVYTVGGTLGYSVGPILGAITFGLLGRYGSVALVPVGLFSSWQILRAFRRLGLGLRQAQQEERVRQQAVRWGPLAPVLAVSMLRNWVLLSVITMIPLWYQDLGYRPAVYGVLTSVVIFSGAVGAILGGVLADRIGARRVLVMALAGSVPSLFLFVLFPGYPALLFGVMFGLLGEAPVSITLVMAQRLLPGRVGMASGFVLGLGFVTGGIGVPITGAMADRYGTANALMLVSILILLAIAAAALIPRAAIVPRQAPALQPMGAAED